MTTDRKQQIWQALDADERAYFMRDHTYPEDDKETRLADAQEAAWQAAEKTPEEKQAQQEYYEREKAQRAAWETRALTCSECGAAVTADKCVNAANTDYVSCAACLRADGLDRLVTWEVQE